MRIGIVKVICFNCGKVIYVKESCVRDKMFCTIGCLDALVMLSADVEPRGCVEEALYGVRNKG